VLVRDANEPVDVRRLVEDAAALARRGGIPVTEVTAEEGGGPLGRFASLVGLLDFSAVYVGLASGAVPAGKENP
jgi:glucose/mannose-6-phosphate isomerase